jgi:hypothetical protein
MYVPVTYIDAAADGLCVTTVPEPICESLSVGGAGDNLYLAPGGAPEAGSPLALYGAKKAQNKDADGNTIFGEKPAKKGYNDSTAINSVRLSSPLSGRRVLSLLYGVRCGGLYEPPVLRYFPLIIIWRAVRRVV